MKYGTAGFRGPAENIINISSRIGKIMAYLSNNRWVGIMITASHNPHEDNGVKLVTYDGTMLDNQQENIVKKYINPLKILLAW
jgi:phosphoacetylglucosamine mutase